MKTPDDIEAAAMSDAVDRPRHYTSHPSGIECITVVEHFGFNIGNAMKYLWRAGIKTENPFEDLRKSAWYIQREIERLTRLRSTSVLVVEGSHDAPECAALQETL